MLAGLAWLVAGGAGGIALAVATHGDGPWGWAIGAAVVGYLIATVAAIVPQQVRLEVAPGEVLPSWRRGVRNAEVALGPWVVAGVDASMGVVAHVRGDGGRLRIGGEQHAGDGYALTGAPARTVDCHLAAADFDALLAALGVRRGATGPLVIPLVRSTQTAGGVLRMMSPWLATMAVAGGFGLVVATLGESLTESPSGQLVIGGVTAAIVVGGLALTIVRSMRVRRPERELRVEAADLVVANVGGGELARAGWGSVTAEPRVYRVGSGAGRFAMPALELTVGDMRLRVAAWDHRLAWPDGTPRVRRGPRWLVGSPQWPRLVAVLQERGTLSPLSPSSASGARVSL